MRTRPFLVVSPLTTASCCNAGFADLSDDRISMVSASAGGMSPLLRTGWPQGADGHGGQSCTCDNNASEHLHCREVPDSLVRESPAARAPGDARSDPQLYSAKNHTGAVE